MKKLILIPMLLCAAAASGFAQSVIIPQTMSFQGYVLAPNSDTALTGTVTVTLALYLSADTSDTNQVWTQISQNVPVFNGYYSVMLNLAPTSAWTANDYGFNQPLWLDAYVNSNHLIPRVQLTASAYSFRAQVADSARVGDTASVALNLASGSPIGTIEAYGGPPLTVAQEKSLGWYVCDGTAVSQSDYPNYWQLCGPIYGYTGSGNDSSYLPDLRGLFLRGVNGTRADSLADPDDSLRFAFNSGNAGNKVGSIQEDAMLDHAHQAAYYAPGIDPSVANWGDGPILNTENSNPEAFDGGMPEYHPGATSNVGPPISHGLVVYRRSSETRPKNAYVYWIIKVK